MEQQELSYDSVEMKTTKIIVDTCLVVFIKHTILLSNFTPKVYTKQKYRHACMERLTQYSQSRLTQNSQRLV